MQMAFLYNAIAIDVLKTAAGLSSKHGSREQAGIC